MRRRFPSLQAGTALALVAIVATASLAEDRIRDGAAHAPRARAMPAIGIAGSLARPLRPGMTQRLNLRLTNRSARRVLVTKLTVALKVDRAHMRLGCSRARSFRVSRLRRRDYPLAVPARRTRSLRALGVRRVLRVRMLDLPTNQDACKGAKLRLHYRALTRRARKAGRR